MKIKKQSQNDLLSEIDQSKLQTDSRQIFLSFHIRRVCTKSLCSRGGTDKKSLKERKCMDREALGEKVGEGLLMSQKKFSNAEAVEFEVE